MIDKLEILAWIAICVAMALSQERTALTYSFIFLQSMVKDSNHWMKYQNYNFVTLAACISFADFFNKLINHNCFLLEFIFFIFLLYIITNIIHETNDLIKCFLHIHLDIFRSGRYNSTHRRREP